jgi:hypothetical protein
VNPVSTWYATRPSAAIGPWIAVMGQMEARLKTFVEPEDVARLWPPPLRFRWQRTFHAAD